MTRSFLIAALTAPFLAGCLTTGSDRAFEDFARASYDLPPSTAAASERSLTQAVAAASPPRVDQVNPCDQLAADPADPRRVTAGVATAAIDAAAAEPACALAADLFGYDPRFGYQLARVYAKQRRMADAQPLLESAAAAPGIRRRRRRSAPFILPAAGRAASTSIRPSTSCARPATAAP